ncbi:galactoside 2-alpha-L-fucosyltransferase-like isoform X2 [Lotus japonicus]|uniref:galactoside 2-alpha-L-fucosyltransferase-like isoform X2 n=2 Tax=Lotus japonicus TaxID=34305 RepID=UPI002585D15C|nr:galactoside 2-alpha-L-fucosyltransferase-like isoform X2 [Lotus japonicus]XP_057453349.1 galactoside 2-alpha-L-fucosyltransferase-like isoform X2 [Lotus japonicus]XP_057453350.1 galactoside 2-alpha-L-fucosyltransferase-like isoform X2 [Lotus japonicus]
MPGIFPEQAHTQTISDIGPKNLSFEDKKNDPSLSTTSITNDQLLDGLLVSTFDKAMCLSRFQSHLYRKASPHKPSAYLISKLRNYESLHRSCGPHTKSYNKIMSNGAKFSKNSAGIKCKYLVWTASNGLGNRMLTLAAAFLYAILTDRVLLVQFRADMFDLFCEPFPDSSWLLPRNFPYWKDQRHIETYENVLMKSKKNISPEVLPQFLILNLQHTHDGHNNFFHCDRSQGLLQKVPVLILWSDQYFVPSLFMIPSYRQDLIKMFPQKDTVFHHLGRYLFHPSNEAWELISRSYKAHLAKADEKIGLQIRVFNSRNHKTPHQTIVNEIIACTSKHKLLPELDMQKSATYLKKQTSKAVLVASLYSVYGEKLRTMYLTNTTVTRDKVIEVFQPSHEERQNSNNDTHNIKAWTEIYLLSLCDALITSSKSTFGYVAHSLGGMKPWLLRRAYGETIPDPPCKRVKSMEPCFHYPPKYDCRDNRTVDFTSLFHYMKHCEDVTSGLRLVNANS